MALDQIRLGTPPSGQDGDDARTAFTRCNNNFKSLDDWGLTGPITRAVTNYNDAIAAGWHSALAGTEANRPPNVQYALVFVGVHSGGYLVQTATDILNGRSARRVFRSNDSTWGAWRQSADTDLFGTAAFATLTQSTTDTATGRVLKVGDYAIGGYVGSIVFESIVINSLTTTGDYYITTTNGIGQLPIGTNGYMRVVGHSAQFVLQTFTAVDLSGTWIRRMFSGTWGPWRRVYNSFNAVGTVTSDGNDSAIVERGSNANGHYVRYIDGTQICWTAGASLLTAVGIGTVSWIFPIQFSAGVPGYVGMSIEPGVGSDVRNYVASSRYQGTTANDTSFITYCASAVGAKAIAIGRWK